MLATEYESSDEISTENYENSSVEEFEDYYKRSNFGIVQRSHSLMNLSNFTRSKLKAPCRVDFLWGQGIKLFQVVSTSEFYEY